MDDLANPPLLHRENVPKKKHLVRKRWTKDDLSQLRAHSKGKNSMTLPERIAIDQELD